MNELIKQEKIENLIYEIRGKQVMLDSDLARLYECANGTKDINKAVKRNINRFPDDFYFQLTDEEKNNLWFQIGTANKKSRTNPYVFTEEGVAMLSSVLRTDISTKMCVIIIRAFVYMRKYISNDLIRNNDILVNHENRILKLEESFNKLSSKQNSIIFEDKIYDAYSILLDIFNNAEKEIIIIDNFANKELLDALKNIDKNIIIISKNIDNVLISKYCKQYKNIKFINNDSFHDRYIILDKKEVYVSGMSLKDIGKKYSYIYKMNEPLFINELIKRIDNIIDKQIE